MDPHNESLANLHKNKIYHLRLTNKGPAAAVGAAAQLAELEHTCIIPPWFPTGGCMVTVYAANAHFLNIDSLLGAFSIESNIPIQGADAASGSAGHMGHFRTLCTLSLCNGYDGAAGITSALTTTVRQLEMSGQERTFRCTGGLPSAVSIKLTGQVCAPASIAATETYVAQPRSTLTALGYEVMMQVEYD